MWSLYVYWVQVEGEVKQCSEEESTKKVLYGVEYFDCRDVLDIFLLMKLLNMIDEEIEELRKMHIGPEDITDELEKYFRKCFCFKYRAVIKRKDAEKILSLFQHATGRDIRIDIREVELNPCILLANTNQVLTQKHTLCIRKRREEAMRLKKAEEDTAQSQEHNLLVEERNLKQRQAEVTALLQNIRKRKRDSSSSSDDSDSDEEEEED